MVAYKPMRLFLRESLVLFGMMCLASFMPAQQAPDATAADTAYRDKNWQAAEKLYAQLTQSNPAVGRYWYRLSVSQQNAGHSQEALKSLETARTKGVPPFFVDYARADIYASTGDKDKAFAALQQAAKSGFAQPDQLESDSDLKTLKNDPRYSSVLEQVKRNQSPCEYSLENRQFDFWIGEWDAIPTGGGPTQGSSHIAKALEGCAIWENWTGLGGNGYEGKSYNVYNPSLKRWEQFWVDNRGGMIHFYGGMKNGVMDYWTDEIPQPDGTKLQRHLQFFNQGPDKVRQFSQGSTDGGKTWHVEYDLTYMRRKADPNVGTTKN